MEEIEHPYELLNLPLNADPKKIKERYYSLSKVFHPDKQSFEMYEYTKIYFEKIEESYKAIASPFNRFLFENLGYEGIHLLEKNYYKFIDLEEAYNNQDSLLQNALSNNEAPEKIKLIKNKHKSIQNSILNRYAYLIRKSTEQEMCIRFYKNNSVLSTIDCSYYFDNSENKIEPKNKLFLSNLMYSSAVNLPEIFKTQAELGFFIASENKNNLKSGFIFAFSRQFYLPLIKMIDVKTSFSLNSHQKMIGLIVGKSTDYGNIQFNMNASKDGISPIISFNKNLSENSAMVISTLVSMENFKINPGFIYAFKKYQLKSKTDLDLSEDNVELSQTFIKKINKSFSVNAGFSAKIRLIQKNEYHFQIMNFVGLKYNISKVSSFEILNKIGLGQNGVTLKFTRYTFKLEVPLKFSNFPTYNGILFQIGLSLSFLGIIKLHTEWKKTDGRKLKKQQIHNKIRLVEQKSAFNMALNDISHISQKNLMKEKKLIQKNGQGLIILKALYGEKGKIHRIMREEKKKNAQIFSIDDLVFDNNQGKENLNINEFDIFSETLDVTEVLQFLVKNSVLQFKLENFRKVHGIFNPCLKEHEESPILFIKYLFRNKISFVLLKKDKDQCIIGNVKKTTFFSLSDFILKIKTP